MGRRARRAAQADPPARIHRSDSEVAVGENLAEAVSGWPTEPSQLNAKFAKFAKKESVGTFLLCVFCVLCELCVYFSPFPKKRSTANNDRSCRVPPSRARSAM